METCRPCGEASLLAKNPELLNVTKSCIEGADMLRSIADIWDLASGVAEDSDKTLRGRVQGL